MAWRRAQGWATPRRSAPERRLRRGALGGSCPWEAERAAGGQGTHVSARGRQVMADWKKICCAIDFSGTSRFAMEKAADLAKRLEGDLALLHVNDVAVGASDETGVSMPTLLEEAAREFGPKLEMWQRQAETLVGRPVRTHV